MSDASPPVASRRVSRGAVLAIVATVIALLGALATLFDWFESRVSEPRPAVATSIRRAQLEPTRERLGDFLKERSLSTEGLTPRELREEGLIFSVDVRLEGDLGETLRLRWRLHRAGGGAVPGRLYDRVVGEYLPQHQDHSRRTFFWLPYPPRKGTYYARFSLIDEARRPIDVITTDPFRLARVPR